MFRPRRSLAAIVLLLALAAGADLVAGQLITGRIRADARRHLTGPISVSLGGAPALVDAVSGSIGSVTLTAFHTRLCHLPRVQAHVTLSGVRVVRDGASVREIEARVRVPASALSHGLRTRGPAQFTVTPDPASNALRFTGGPGGVLQFDEVPTLRDHLLVMRPSSITVLGRPAPPQLAQLITRRASATRFLPSPLGLQPTRVQVTQGALQIELARHSATVIRSHRRPRPACR